MIETLKQEIKDLLWQPLLNEGAEIVELVISKYKHNTTLRLFIYTDNKTTLDECARVSRIVGDIIDGTEYFNSGYNLEVSSPGLTRPLTTLSDFKYRIGENVRIEFEDRKTKKITAEIIGIENESILFRNKDGEFNFNLTDIKQAKIII